LELFDISEIARESEVNVFRSILESGGIVKGVRYPGGGRLSRSQISELETLAKNFGAKGLANLHVASEQGEKKGIAKYFTQGQLEKIYELSQGKEGDLLLLVADKSEIVCESLARLRVEIGERCGLRDKRKLLFCWILDFPLFFWNDETKSWEPSHHPFTGPKAEDLEFLETDPGKVRADCYDIVCNGVEWASGSIRIHRPDIQARVFRLLGIDEERQRRRFGHMLDAFRFGAPPHGGIAPGIDRLVMLLLGEENIREVIAFPKIAAGYDPMMGAPDTIEPEQWDELGLMLKPREE